MEDLIADEDVVVTVSHAGYIKRVPVTEYREQGRGGRGSRGMETREEDFVTKLFVARNHSHILFFSDKGKVYLKKVYEIPAGTRTARGRAIVNFVGMEAGEGVAAVVPIREFVEGADLLTCTRNGKVKRTSLEAYSNIRATGIIGVAIEEGDALLAARIVKSGQHVLIGTAKGMSIRFEVDEVRPTGRDTMGVKGIELREGDRVVGVDVIESDEQQVLTVSANGYGKRTPVGEWRVQGRGGLGIIAMDTSERNGELVRLCLVRPDDQLMCITDAGVVIRTRCGEIRETGRNTQGVRVIRLGESERVVDVEPIARDESEVDSAEQETRGQRGRRGWRSQPRPRRPTTALECFRQGSPSRGLDVVLRLAHAGSTPLLRSLVRSLAWGVPFLGSTWARPTRPWRSRSTARCEVLPDAEGNKLFPSVVSFHPSGDVLGRLSGARAAPRRRAQHRLLGQAPDRPPVQERRGAARDGALAVRVRGGAHRRRAGGGARRDLHAARDQRVRAARRARPGRGGAQAGLPARRDHGARQLQRAAALGHQGGRARRRPRRAAHSQRAHGRGARLRLRREQAARARRRLRPRRRHLRRHHPRAGRRRVRGGGHRGRHVPRRRRHRRRRSPTRWCRRFLAQHRYDARRDAQAYERLRAAAEWAKCQLSTTEDVELTVEELGLR